MAKKKTTKKQENKYLILGGLITGLLIIIALLGFYLFELGYEQGKKEKIHHTPKHATTSQKITKPQIKPSEIIDLKEASKEAKETQESKTPAKEEKVVLTPSKITKSIPKKFAKHKSARLIIIIDDVAYGYQVKALKKIGIPLNLSFFPPNVRHPNTPKYARSCKHYMIHLPMEALHYPHPEPNTLLVTSSSKDMERIIASIRKNFPRAKYINNHTGSKFTADYNALKRLLPILDKYHFKLLDSRTTPETKIPQLMAELHRPYIARNIFLDNKQDVRYIKEQLKKAVTYAQKHGLAIAIGHPHSATIKAIRESKGLLKKVDLLYIDQL
ncbi:divergent polysaccharide deacetylase family protein [Nitratiruptor sp. YY09-18]|uniref:divergent polysaccharide deacetylase family protein n=1 Tax=Nitratiruptor sp. YY09-18 TaxID=2724901 RepID=UPI001915EA1E|nr:divergent polysaccharide deacetylase family protein [Nitratiruptor sp. YY09-18]BCD67839.1 hypothetical protein NitYY0918_C0746 [Nitratiruptor sp. YY09-18]